MDVTTSGGPESAAPEPAAGERPELDRRVLVSNLASGAAWLALTSPLTWRGPLLPIGVVYVGGASVYLAATHTRPTRTRGQEALAWALVWLAAVVLWFALAGTLGLVVGMVCFLAWQVVALLVRLLLPRSWRGR